MKNLIVALLLCLLVAGVAGCELAGQVVDPNSSLNVAVDTAAKIAPAVAAGAGAAAAAGFPWAACVLLVTNIVSVAIGVYKNHQKNITIGEQDSKYNNTKVTTKAIVEAIEAVGEIDHEDTTVGDIIKEKVEEKLKDKDYYLIGKAVITALKGE